MLCLKRRLSANVLKHFKCAVFRQWQARLMGHWGNTRLTGLIVASPTYSLKTQLSTTAVIRTSGAGQTKWTIGVWVLGYHSTWPVSDTSFKGVIARHGQKLLLY